MRPHNVESLIAVAEAALDARELDKARAKAEAAARMEPRESVYLLLADIEEADTGDQGRIRHWMAQALRAPRDPSWVADGIVSDHWLAVSPATGRIDAFEWKIPFGQLEGPIEEGSLGDKAIAELPPVSLPYAPAASPEETAPEHAATSPNVIDGSAATPDIKQPLAKTPDVMTVDTKDQEEKETREEQPLQPAKAPVVATVNGPVVKPKPLPADAAKDADEAEAERFFHRPPDDPGVKDPHATKEPSNRLRLF